MAYSPATHYQPYVSRLAHSSEAVTWVSIDLGSAIAIDSIRLYPAFRVGRAMTGYGFPLRFKLECSDAESFASARTGVDYTGAAFPNPADHICEFSGQGQRGRFVRLTATRMGESADGIGYQLALHKVEVMSGGKDAAVGCTVQGDREWSDPDSLKRLTRPARPMGEGIVTDNPANVTDAAGWRPPVLAVRVPRSGVQLDKGVLQRSMENNADYLLRSFSIDEMLRPFRERAGKPVAANLRKPIPFWDTELPGSSAGRFLMGAGNTLRWMENTDLREAMNDVVRGIAECRAANGYIMAYPEDTIFVSERGGYTRAWVTHGLIEAGYAGNEQAFDLLRGYYDWFDKCKYLPMLLRGGTQGVQGMVANTRMYFTPVGKPSDIQVIQRYFQENYWLEGLAKHNTDVVWQYPYDRPHNYLITDFEAYLDLYMATGEDRYLQAVLGAWDMYHDNWEHVGGSIAITEFGEFPPKSYRLAAQMPFCETGETCGSVFWVRLNQRLHQLYPEQERYVAEIEKSIYNVGLANQVAGDGIIYHARLVGQKGDVHVPVCTNSCCEGQGTRLLGSVPEYLYSLADDGIRVNLYAPSSIRWQHAGRDVELQTKTDFPFSPDVRMSVQVAEPTRMTLHIRVPSWATGRMTISVGGEMAGSGEPGTFVALRREWKAGDSVAFTLPMGFRVTEYEGMDQIASHRRYALEYGPLLMAVSGSDSAVLRFESPDRLQPVADHALQFRIPGEGEFTFIPYFQVVGEPFTCFPAIEGLKA